MRHRRPFSRRVLYLLCSTHSSSPTPPDSQGLLALGRSASFLSLRPAADDSWTSSSSHINAHVRACQDVAPRFSQDNVASLPLCLVCSCSCIYRRNVGPLEGSERARLVSQIQGLPEATISFGLTSAAEQLARPLSDVSSTSFSSSPWTPSTSL